MARRGLRLLLAALRQLGGVRRGIEIANAHYGYFPIEGRIPLSPLVLSYHVSLALSHSFSPPPPSPPLATPSVAPFEFSFSPSLFRSLHASLHSLSLFFFSSLLSLFSSSASRISISALRSLIASFLILSYCLAIFFSLSPFFSEILYSHPSFLVFLSPSFFFLAKRKRTRKNVDSRSHFPVFHYCLSLWHSHFVHGLFSLLVLSLSPVKNPASGSPFLPLFFALFLLLFHSSLIFLSLVWYILPVLLISMQIHIRILVTRIALRTLSLWGHIRFTHCEPWLFLHRLYAVFIAFIHSHHPLSPASACLFWRTSMTVIRNITLWSNNFWIKLLQRIYSSIAFVTIWQ